MASINPYLNFSGNCEEAFQFYSSIFGGELYISRFDEMPQDESSPPVEDPNQIMHVSLPIGDGSVLMGSDVPPAMGGVNPGNNVQVSIAPDSSAEGKRIFEALADGGQVTMPYDKMFWGAEYGALIDKFGTSWMVNYQEEEWA